MDSIKLEVPCYLGVEKLVADELKRLHMADVRAENGRVSCRGTLADIPRLNLNLRVGARVLLVLNEFTATTFEELFQGVKAVNWQDWIPKDGAFPVKGYSISSQLHSVPACQSIVKKAASAKLGQVYGTEWLPETGETYQIRFSILKDEVHICLDTSGPGLYKRGYRAVGVEAPLRETLAAALVLLTGYKGLDPFCDPFCGSGTIAIEAALIAKNRAPGLNRDFTAEAWGCIPRRAWMDAANEAMDKEYDRPYDIWGGDIDPAAVAIAQSNAEKAGVEDTVRFEQYDARRFYSTSPYGRIVTNPPYGERLMDEAEVARLYHDFGHTVSLLPEGWRVAILSSYEGFETAFGRRARKKRKLYNGMIKCDLFYYGKV
ncbi:MAG: class I SAM-dependent RNA methyltransferase [Clostridiales bacterium]|nr:class I SAM-dependent RNA methyltransferase [Clostridiales bacterium]